MTRGSIQHHGVRQSRQAGGHSATVRMACMSPCSAGAPPIVCLDQVPHHVTFASFLTRLSWCGMRSQKAMSTTQRTHRSLTTRWAGNAGGQHCSTAAPPVPLSLNSITRDCSTHQLPLPPALRFWDLRYLCQHAACSRRVSCCSACAQLATGGKLCYATDIRQYVHEVCRHVRRGSSSSPSWRQGGPHLITASSSSSHLVSSRVCVCLRSTHPACGQRPVVEQWS
jgi:hypothetical protein